ncbi:hypothetical protein ACQKL5_06750 [Peribacillus sp. NPDC097675]|uniref:hypothetical protein n=1 Tax=Peribacillus sp. NPDC097675 TaxID=3390618 RepID=UPI003D025C1A
MRKWTQYIGGATMAAFLLTGCGTTTDDKTAEPQKAPVKEENKGGSTNGADNGSEETKKVRLMEQNLQYTINGEGKEETAFLKNSDNQPFSLYVLQQFELTAEEPGKDILFLSDDDSVSMRIELLADDVKWDEVEANVQTQLKSISEKIEDPALNIDNGSGYEVVNGDEVVTSVLLKDEKAPVRLTMFTKKDTDYRDAFLEMAKTLMKES